MLSISVILIDCTGGHSNLPDAAVKAHTQTNIDTPLINILPLGTVPRGDINLLIKSVNSFYGFKCVVKPRAELTSDLLARSNTRYEAEKILAKFNSKENLLILTDVDIACKNKKRNVDEWGIFGLGYRPGKTCVVSTFRLKKSATEKLFNERLAKICVHEIGHNLGLDHCTGKTDCLMNDANGTIKEVDRERLWLCDNCRSNIKNYINK